MEQDFLPLNLDDMSYPTGNIYKSVSIIGARSNQFTTAIKEDISRRLAEFAPAHDNLDEITENREQIEISKHFERQPKPSQVAVEEFMAHRVYWRNRENPMDSNAPELNV
jgi:flavin-binding protein dodecin